MFGATGDLAGRKLFPSLFGLWQAKLFPDNWALIGIGRKEMSDDSFREIITKSLMTFRKGATAEQVGLFVKHLNYQAVDINSLEGLQTLVKRLDSVNASYHLPGNRLIYLAIDPKLFPQVIEKASISGLTKSTENAWARVIIEKPFGHNLESARKLDAHISKFLRPEQIYRIDHYLGKDTVQNIAGLRFGNSIFEPLFHRNYVDHVQITMAETVGMEGQRGSYYDGSGAIRDVMQNHMLQLLALVAMEPPATLRAQDIINAKLQTLRNLVPFQQRTIKDRVVRAQYTPGAINGTSAKGYLEEEGIHPQSTTESYVAIRTEIDNWRWAGVPFLLRTGKRLARRVTEIAVYFKLPPLSLFRTVECEGDVCDLTAARPNVLVMRIQPNEGISLGFSTKRPGMSLDLHPARLEFDYQQIYQYALPEAYERLLFDAIRGDQTLFMRSDELDTAWEFVQPVLSAWEREPNASLASYAAGSWGPSEADRLTEGISVGWRKP